MINKQFNYFLAAVFFFISSLSYAEVSSDESLNELLDLSGLTMQVNQFPLLIKAGMAQAKQQGTNIPEELYSSLVSSVDATIVPTVIIEEIRVSLRESVSEKEAQKLLTWYKSDLGKEITLAEEGASTPEAYQDMMKTAQELMTDEERVAFAKRVDNLLGATDMAMGIQEHSSIAVYSAIMTAMNPDAPLNIEPYKAQINSARAQMRTAMEKMLIVSLIYSYKNIETEKLTKYEAYLSDETTMKFNKVIMSSMNGGFESSVVKWADVIAKQIKNKTKKKEG